MRREHVVGSVAGGDHHGPRGDPFRVRDHVIGGDVLDVGALHDADAALGENPQQDVGGRAQVHHAAAEIDVREVGVEIREARPERRCIQ